MVEAMPSSSSPGAVSCVWTVELSPPTVAESPLNAFVLLVSEDVLPPNVLLSPPPRASSSASLEITTSMPLVAPFSFPLVSFLLLLIPPFLALSLSLSFCSAFSFFLFSFSLVCLALTFFVPGFVRDSFPMKNRSLMKSSNSDSYDLSYSNSSAEWYAPLRESTVDPSPPTVDSPMDAASSDTSYWWTVFRSSLSFTPPRWDARLALAALCNSSWFSLGVREGRGADLDRRSSPPPAPAPAAAAAPTATAVAPTATAPTVPAGGEELSMSSCTPSPRPWLWSG
mmetsp:Transcript_30997/g.92898  ORF Transcript_30997/g.92898 Transcript_30997/m.92898 type:complete len:283 (-) Transcript_30997:4273-5121(-)